MYTKVQSGGRGYFLTPQDKRINQTRGVEEMNWGVEPPNPSGNSHTERWPGRLTRWGGRLKTLHLTSRYHQNCVGGQRETYLVALYSSSCTLSQHQRKTLVWCHEARITAVFRGWQSLIHVHALRLSLHFIKGYLTWSDIHLTAHFLHTPYYLRKG